MFTLGLSFVLIGEGLKFYAPQHRRAVMKAYDEEFIRAATSASARRKAEIWSRIDESEDASEKLRKEQESGRADDEQQLDRERRTLGREREALRAELDEINEGPYKKDPDYKKRQEASSAAGAVFRNTSLFSQYLWNTGIALMVAGGCGLAFVRLRDDHALHRPPALWPSIFLFLLMVGVVLITITQVLGFYKRHIDAKGFPGGSIKRTEESRDAYNRIQKLKKEREKISDELGELREDMKDYSGRNSKTSRSEMQSLREERQRISDEINELDKKDIILPNEGLGERQRVYHEEKAMNVRRTELISILNPFGLVFFALGGIGFAVLKVRDFPRKRA